MNILLKTSDHSGHLPDSSTKKRGPPILPSKMITSSASKSDEKVAATNLAAMVPSARYAQLLRYFFENHSRVEDKLKTKRVPY